MPPGKTNPAGAIHGGSMDDMFRISGQHQEPPEVKPRIFHKTCIDGHATTNARLITEDIRAMMWSGDIFLN